ncbi:MAG: hypothetical protein D6784_04655 [Chloroflexi bacterium]|nr:MAG: hypothetical protein D6784_04655 [Chloroflexota bacterium]
MTALFNLERILSYQIEANLIQSGTYIFVITSALVPLLFPRLNRRTFAVVLAAIAGSFLVNWYLDPDWERTVAAEFVHLNAAVVLLLLQISMIVVTGLLVRQIANSLIEFEDVIAQIIYSHLGGPARPFDEEQSVMYREVRRAVRYGRPLAVVAVTVDEASLSGAVPRIVEEIQQAMLKEFTLAKIAGLLTENTFDCDIVALSGNNFIVLLPEASAQDVPKITRRLEAAVQQKLGIAVKTGTATLPDEATTFDRLIELAMAQARQDRLQPASVSSIPDRVRNEV